MKPAPPPGWVNRMAEADDVVDDEKIEVMRVTCPGRLESDIGVSCGRDVRI